MARCPTCHRRLGPAARCPQDGSQAPAGEPTLAPDAPPDLPGFTIGAPLGTGGFGVVWSGRADDGQPVAIKVSHATDAASVARLAREGEALSRVGPPCVPAFHAGGTLPDGRAYLAMERLQGRTLADELEGWAQPPTLEQAVPLAESLLGSVSALHTRGVIHRDLKPENVFLVGEGAITAKLMDLGFAVPVAAAGQQQPIVDAGAGTPEYIAPEQIAAKPADRRADVYTLGVMLFELFTLRLPFAGERRELEYAHLSFRPPRPTRFAPVPEPIEQLILRCLAKDPAARFVDGTALRAAFTEAVQKARTQASAGHKAVDAPAAATAALKSNDRQKVALVFARGQGSAMDVQAALQPFGGQLAHIAPGQYACAFTHRAGDNPGQRALAAAEALVQKGLCTHAIIDVGTVTVKPRPDGPPRLLGALFSQPARYPNESDAKRILISAAARPMLPGAVGEAAPGRPDHYFLAAAADDLTRTVIGAGADPLIGRDAEVDLLTSEAAGAIADRRPRVATVLADAGLGKTRVAVELARRLSSRLPLARVIELRAREPLGNDADETIAELLRRALGLSWTVPPNGGQELLAERLGERAPEVYAAAALALGWISAGHPAVQALQAAPGVLRASVERATMLALRQLAATRPVVIILDDAHWADDTLLGALEQATVSDLPLWICAFGRPGFAASRPTWGRRAAQARSLRLEPLAHESAVALCRHLLRPADNVPEPVVEQIVERTQGLPQLLCDLVNGLRREGLVRKQAGEVWYVATEVLDRVPDSPLVEWLARRELDELPVELAAHARLASLLSAEFAADELQGVLGVMDAELAEGFPLDARIGLERLTKTRLLVLHRTGRLAFRTGVQREAVARTVSDQMALRIHRAALEYYRSAPLPDSTRLPRLAWHAAQAGERQEAATTYLLLADSARERHNYLEGDLLYSRALEQITADNEDRLRAWKGRGIMRYRLGRHEGSLTDLAQARELAARSGDAITEADVCLDESMALDWLYEWRRSSELAERARELIEDSGLTGVPPLFKARVLLALGRSCQRFNQDRDAAELLREAARLAGSIGDAGYEVAVTAALMLGFLLPFLGLLDEAEEHLARANALAEAKGDELHQAAVWNNRSCLWIARNDRDRFIEDTSRTLAFARRMGNAHLERNSNHNSAYFLYWRGELEAALPYVQRAIDMDERYFRQGSVRPECAVLLARILWARGDEAESRKLVTQVRAHQTDARDRGQSELLLQPNDEMLLDLIALALEGGDGAAWESMMKRAREVAQGQELIEALEIAGTVALSRGDREGARRWWQEALTAGEKIPNVMGERLRLRLSDLAA
jgi:tetratricopeptide (TPR) repeat protein